MASKIGSNTFTGGLNTDSDINTQPSNTYRDAVNIDTVDNGSFSALTNVKGTTEVGVLQSLIGSDDVNILLAIDASGVFNGNERPCVVYFVLIGTNSRIYALNTQDNNVATIFDETKGDLAFPANGTVDAYYNKEKGLNTIYFVDFLNELRQIVIDDSNTNTIDDLTSRPTAAIDTLTFDSLQDGGQLVSGTYQFAYRYTNIGTTVVSAWSSPINPIPVIPKELADVTDADKIIGGVIGKNTGKSIKLSLGLTANASRYDAVQIAVIRNTTGSTTAEITAVILGASTDYYDDPTNILYTGTENGTTSVIEDIIVEDTPINTAKTIDQKDNRLFLGNVKLNDLTIADSEGTFTGAKTISDESDDSYKEVNDTYAARGHFRGELYRYARMYEDKFGNTSPPRPLNFNSVRRYLQDSSFAGQLVTSVVVNATTSDIKIAGNHTSNLKHHDWIARFGSASSSDVLTARFKLIADSTFDGTHTTIVVAGDYGAATEYLLRLIGDEGNCIGDKSTSIDWKFPERSVNKFSLLNANDQASNKPSNLGGKTTYR